uniref:Uncharacterized protein n=1 Tax=Tetradesmus obliquus TaxID=3088 RepID=A0A383WK01_TETOB|eukprot:jgi/Sobl393_1/10878/SZX77552.1
MMGTAQLSLQKDNRLSENSRDCDFSWRPPADQFITLLLPLNSGQALKELQVMSRHVYTGQAAAPCTCAPLQHSLLLLQLRP